MTAYTRLSIVVIAVGFTFLVALIAWAVSGPDSPEPYQAPAPVATVTYTLAAQGQPGAAVEWTCPGSSPERGREPAWCPARVPASGHWSAVITVPVDTWVTVEVRDTGGSPWCGIGDDRDEVLFDQDAAPGVARCQVLA